jgi:SAM-dependent methyltransferase
LNIIRKICPACGNPFEDDVFSCQSCNIEFPRINGVVCFTGTDNFYEGRFTSTSPIVNPAAKTRFLRFLYSVYIKVSASERVRAFYQKFIPENDGQKILDVGCGGGDEFIASRGYTVGIDMSQTSLTQASRIYNEVFSCDAANMPFADNSFDIVISSNFFGHIRPDDKDVIIADMVRVLRPGGCMIHNIETHAHNSFIRFLHESPETFQRVVVGGHGHYGLELPSYIMRRFENVGLEIVSLRKHFGNIGSIDFYELREYVDTRYWTRIVSQINKWAVRNSFRKAISNVILGLAVTAECILIPIDAAQGIIIFMRLPEQHVDKMGE